MLPVFCIAAAVVLLAVLTAGFYLDWIRSRQQTAAAVPAFPAAEAKKEEPADRRAAEEKIPGYAHPEALISIYELNEKYGDPN
ncbi:MAG: hypothetical protein K6T80_07775, partial [Firmicutes bacterium]|nr:hypothetical protein [Bacillota bacterium]